VLFRSPKKKKNIPWYATDRDEATEVVILVDDARFA
jgi:hypothetical protein